MQKSDNFSSKNFFWGAATSSYQVEGGNFNDWSEWEVSPARISDLEKRGLKKEDFISGRACDHYNFFKKDFDITKSLGHNAHRFSIEWSRIQPIKGEFNQQELFHYKEVVRSLRDRGIEPFVTLWHWPVPLWIRDLGGWESKETIKYFEEYVGRVVSEFPEVRFWITLNEPEIYTFNSYLRGIWPPQKKSIFSFLKIFGNLIKAHKMAYWKIHSISKAAQVGIAKNNSYFDGSPLLSRLVNYFWNEYFLDKIKNQQDFIGLNYYFHNRIKNFAFNQNENKEVSDTGWEIYPEGLYKVLLKLKKYNKPIFITENGIADAKDEKRAGFIRSHIEAMVKAASEGADVRGYFYWSLVDNFEWAAGFAPRFGLVEIDYKTLERKIRPSAYEYKKIIEGFNGQ